MASGIAELIATGLGLSIGSLTAIGIISFILLVVVGVVFRLSVEAFVVIGLPMLLLLGVYGFLPTGVYYTVLLLCGVIIFMALLAVVRR